MGKLTTHEVLKQTEIKSSKTLTRWYKLRLIPPPSIQTHPNGRGKIAYWPSWVVVRIHEVKSCLARGMSLSQIAKSLSHDWSAEEKQSIRERPDIAAAFARMNRDEAIDKFAEWAAEIVYDYLRQIGVQRPGSIYRKLWNNFSTPGFVNEVLQLLRRGYTPVVAIAGKDIKVVPDFLLAAAVSNPKCSNRPLLVVPIGQAFLDAFAVAEPELPKEPKFAPALCVLERDEKKARERKYKQKGLWGFVLEE